MKKRGKILLLISGLFLFLGITAISYAIFTYNKIFVGKQNISLENNTTPTPTPDPMSPKNVLLLGYGGSGHEGGALTDTIILAHIIPTENKVFLISIPRDTWVELTIKDDPEHYKINHAFAIGVDDVRFPDKKDIYKGIAGGGLLAKEAAQKVTGLKIDYFVSIDFSGFKNIIEILDGVEINIPYSFIDEYYPIKGMEEDVCGKNEDEMKAIHATMSGELLEKEFKCRYETLEFSKGLVVLDGETALKFVRSRHSEINGNDFGRSMRQQALITAVKDEVLSLGSVTKIIPLVNSITKNIQTDIDIKSGLELFSQNYNFTDVVIKSISLNTDNVFVESKSDDRQYILIPKAGMDNFREVHLFVEEQLAL